MERRHKKILTDSHKREILRVLDGKFPVHIENASLSEFAEDVIDPHWHLEIEFVFTSRGGINYEVEGKKLVLEQGDGLFLNTNALHGGRPYNNADCKFRVIRLDTALFGGDPGLSIYEKYINPILSNKNLPYVYLSHKVDWQKRILEELDLAADAYFEHRMCYEMDILARMLKIWHLLFENVFGQETGEVVYSKDIQKIDAALSYIQQHFMEKVTLGDIVRASSLSRAKCCELFNRILHQSPVEYLVSYRINRSLSLLAADDMPITEIAAKTGFSGGSYFSDTFRRQMGMTPSEYRHNYRDFEPYNWEG